MTQTLRDLMEANDEQPDQHVRETFTVETPDGGPIPVDIVGHYDGPAHQTPRSTDVRVWDPACTQPAESRPYAPIQLLYYETIADYGSARRKPRPLGRG
jgi:hypothetical protein